MPCVVCGKEIAEGLRICEECASPFSKEGHNEGERISEEARAFIEEMTLVDSRDIDVPMIEGVARKARKLSEATRNHKEVQRGARDLFVKVVRMFSNNFRYADEIEEAFGFSQEVLSHLVEVATYSKMEDGDIDGAKNFREEFDGPPMDRHLIVHGLCFQHYRALKEEMQLAPPSELDEYETIVWEFFSDPDVSDALKAAYETSEFLRGCIVGRGGSVRHLDVRAALRARLTHKLSPMNMAVLSHDAMLTDEEVARDDTSEWGHEPSPKLHERKARALAVMSGNLKREEQDWAVAEWLFYRLLEVEELSTPDYNHFVDDVGATVCLEFLNRPDLPIHDAVRFDRSLQHYMYQNWPWEDGTPTTHETESEFAAMAHDAYGQLLRQVAKDDSQYEVGCSQIEIGRILENLNNTKVADLLEAAKSLDVPGLSERLTRLKEPKYDPLRTWKGLRIVAEIQDMVNRVDVSCLRNLTPEMKRFVGGLMESPVISTLAIEEFVTNPQAFLDRQANYAEERQHQFAPARFAEVERTGLTHEMVRDALFDGTLDRLGLLPPFEETYHMTVSGEMVTSSAYVHRELVRALGQRSKGIAGEARDSKRLFHRLQQWLLDHVPVSDTGEPLTRDGVAVILRRWVKDGEAPALPSETLLTLTGQNGLLYDRDMGVDAPTIFEVRARVGKKSDPSLRASAESVSNCMPFGDGKTNVYDWNPAIAQMLVERRMEDGHWMAIAQSVLMIDHELHGVDAEGRERNAADAVDALRNGQRTTEVLHEEDLLGTRVLVADNIEPNKNELEAGRQPVIEAAYRRFAEAYLKQLPLDLQIDRGRFVVGKELYNTGHKDWTFEQKPNRYVPGSPVSYMDSCGRNVYELTFAGEVKETAERSSAGIVDIDASHILAMSFLEGKGFEDNPSLIFGLADRYRRILATGISREHFGDPNLMFMTRGVGGRVEGYLLARVDHSRIEHPEVYMDDIAVDRTRGMASARSAMRLVGTFLERYVAAYTPDEALLPPISAEMRESTSYQLVTRKIDQLIKQTGRSLVYEVVEYGDVSMGGETFKNVRIFLGRNQEELDSQKEQFA